MRIGNLWIQEQIEDGELEMQKVRGEWNPADLLTKGLNREKMERFIHLASQRVVTGRAEKSLELQRSSGM